MASVLREFCATCLRYILPEDYDGHKDAGHDVVLVLPESEQKCTFEGCENRGAPQKGFDFYMCDDCSEELQRQLEQAWLDKYVRMPQN